MLQHSHTCRKAERSNFDFNHCEACTSASQAFFVPCHTTAWQCLHTLTVASRVRRAEKVEWSQSRWLAMGGGGVGWEGEGRGGASTLKQRSETWLVTHFAWRWARGVDGAEQGFVCSPQIAAIPGCDGAPDSSGGRTAKGGGHGLAAAGEEMGGRRRVMNLRAFHMWCGTMASGCQRVAAGTRNSNPWADR